MRASVGVRVGGFHIELRVERVKRLRKNVGHRGVFMPVRSREPIPEMQQADLLAPPCTKCHGLKFVWMSFPASRLVDYYRIKNGLKPFSRSMQGVDVSACDRCLGSGREEEPVPEYRMIERQGRLRG